MKEKNKTILQIISTVGVLVAAVLLCGGGLIYFIYELVTDTKNALLRYLIYFLASGPFIGVWMVMHEKAMDKSKIDWHGKYRDLRWIKNTLIGVGVLGNFCFFVSVGTLFIWGDYYKLAVLGAVASLFFTIYVIYLDVNFIKGKLVALLNIRFSLFAAIFAAIFFFYRGVRYGAKQQQIDSLDFLNVLVVVITMLLITTLMLKCLFVTYGNSAKEFFSKGKSSIKFWDIFLGIVLLFFTIYSCRLDYSPIYKALLDYTPVYKILKDKKEIKKQHQMPTKLFKATSIAFLKDNEIHKFNNTDSLALMNITDKSDSVCIVWPPKNGAKEVLYKSLDNNKMFISISEYDKSDGVCVYRAFRDSTNKICLVTVEFIEHGSKDENHMVIDYKP